MSNDRVSELKSLLLSAGIGKQGRSRSPEGNATSLLTIHTIQTLDHSLDQSIKATAQCQLASPARLRHVREEFLSTGNISPPDNSHRGRGNPDHPLNSNNIIDSTDTPLCGPSLLAELLIHNLVRSQKDGDKSVTATTIRAELRDQLQVYVHQFTVRRWLHALGYRWRHKRYVGGMKPQAKNARIRQFIIEYAQALKEEEEGTAVVVYMDESYINTHLANKYGWFHEDDRDVIGDCNGKRLIIMHAMSERGLLAIPEAVASNWLSEPALTAELVFEEVLEDGQDNSDYHNTMTGAKFVAWLSNRLLPTFNSMYPDKRMYLVLDNAAYHKARDETWISDKSKNKHELAHMLIEIWGLDI